MASKIAQDSPTWLKIARNMPPRGSRIAPRQFQAAKIRPKTDRREHEHVDQFLDRLFEPCWAILSDLGGHLGLSEVLLEPSWAILGALPTRETPVQVQGRGYAEG